MIHRFSVELQAGRQGILRGGALRTRTRGIGVDKPQSCGNSKVLFVANNERLGLHLKSIRLKMFMFTIYIAEYWLNIGQCNATITIANSRNAPKCPKVT
jgi:hypothetical protein